MKKAIILIDDSYIKDNIIMALNKNGFTTTEASNEKTAAVLTVMHNPDIIICDSKYINNSPQSLPSLLEKDLGTRAIPVFAIENRPTSSEDYTFKINLTFIKMPLKIQNLLNQINIAMSRKDENPGVLLIIDENKEEYSEVVDLFIKNGLRPVIAKSAADSQKYLKEVPPIAIISEIYLSDSSGFDVLKEVRTVYSDHSIPFVFVTSKATKSNFRFGKDLGADDLLVKPINADELYSTVSSRIRKMRLRNQKNKTMVRNSQLVAAIEKSKELRDPDTKVVLLIEDEIELHANLRFHLEKKNFSVLSAETAETGIELAYLNLPDVILCDIMLPDMDGYNILKVLNSNDNTAVIPFIFISAKTEFSDIRIGMTLGADDYFTKPFKIGDLINTINNKINYPDVHKPKDEKLSVKELKDKSTAKTPFNQLLNKIKEFTPPPEAKIVEQKTGSVSSVGTLNKQTKTSVMPTKKDKQDDGRIRLSDVELLNKNRNEIIDYESVHNGTSVYVLVNLLRCNLREANEFGKYLEKFYSLGCVLFFIDLNNITSLDATFLGVIVSLMKRTIAKNGNVVIILDTKKTTINPMLVQGLSRVFEVVPSMNHAFES